METNTKRLFHTLFPFIIFVLVQRLLQIIFGMLSLPLDSTLTGLLSFLPASAAAVILFRLKTYSVSDEEENAPVAPPEKSPPVLGLLGIIAAVALMIVLMFLISVPFRTESLVPAQGLTAFISLIIIHPVVEEYIFRGLFYGELRRMHPVFGCLVQTVMFAIIHDSVAGMIFALGSGIVLAYLAENTGRLWVPITAHAVINLRSYLCLTVLADSPLLSAAIDRIFLVGGFISFILFLIIRNAPHRETAESEEDA